MTLLSKVLEKKVFESYLLITIKIYSASCIIYCQLNWYLLFLLVEINMGHAHKTSFWYFLGVFSKFSDEHLRHFY